MIVEERMYRIRPGKTAEFQKHYEQLGMGPQRRILGNLVGHYRTEVGELNLIVHMWAYEDPNDRARRRAQLMQDPDFRKYLEAVVPLIEHQQNRILVPAPFFVPVLKAMLEAAAKV